MRSKDSLKHKTNRNDIGYGCMLIAFFVWSDMVKHVLGGKKTHRKNTIFRYAYSWLISTHSQKITSIIYNITLISTCLHYVFKVIFGLYALM